MARRRGDEEHDNLERWLVSYADFITLMFAFFVVLYSISQLNEGKYKILADTLTKVFRAIPSTTSGGSPIPNPAARVTDVNAAIDLPVSRQATREERQQEQAIREAAQKLRQIAKDVAEILAPLVKQGQVRVTEGAFGVAIDINANVLFLPGDARLSNEAMRAMTAVARVLAPLTFPITVEGHTDSQPISSAQFPSNWELSGARASSVVRMFIANGVAPKLLTATGYADQRPVADNNTVEGRNRNRRVVITIESPRILNDRLEANIPLNGLPADDVTTTNKAAER